MSAQRHQPCVVPSELIPEPPELALSHTEELAVPVAGPAAVGIDLEPVSGPAERILDDFARPEERALLEPLAAAYPVEAWPTRLWCAKEAAGKAQGLGLLGQAFDFQLVAAEPGGRMQILHRPTSRMWTAQTLRDQQHILAYSLSADIERLESGAYAIVAS